MTDYLSRAELVHIAQAALVDRFGPVPTPGAFAVVDVVVDALHEVGALPMAEEDV